MSTKLILSSTSQYRRQLLQRLHIPFSCHSPNIDESPHINESPEHLVARLALAKAQVISQRDKDAVVIGSDQVALLDKRIIGKPGNKLAATEQLLACSGKAIQFYTGLAVCCKNTEFQRVHIELFTVHFRPLTNSIIERYLDLEQPYDCAGSFKCEGLGIALFSKMQGDDPTSLQGLPLIALTGILPLAGIKVI
ncbi:MAG: MAF protein [Alcanivorax sp.]|jgi:septum formation protein